MRSKTKKTAVCGFAAALSVVLMLITAVAPFFMYVLPIASGLIVLFIADFAGKKWAVAVYFATGSFDMRIFNFRRRLAAAFFVAKWHQVCYDRENAISRRQICYSQQSIFPSISAPGSFFRM